MCLKVKNSLHPDRRIRVATRPLIVRKDLDARYRFNVLEYESPFYPGGRNGTWKLGELKTEKLKKVKSDPWGHDIPCRVHFGLHSALPRRGMCATTRLWAVIPKGSRFYIGCKDDIVSDKLVVFETEKDVCRYLGISSIPESVKARNANSYSKLLK